ncbi:MBL fold metallo-hydrolase [Halorubrum ezzemoulense]|uniref:MBL fold metallo-hydrolase n=1 Tax=Halorubrum ezzemoulense TaxID=337243 RepID=UPI003D7DA0C8
MAAVVDRTGAAVFAHEAEAPYLEGDEELVKSSEERPTAIEPATVDVRLTGGETFATAAGPTEVVPIPGHSPGHVSAYFPGAELLVSADGELAGVSPEMTPDLDTALESVAVLADRDVAETVCFHGGHVEAGTERLEEIAGGE